MRTTTDRGPTGVGLVALSAVAFGTLAIFGKLANRIGMPLSELLGLRFGIAAVLLWGLAVVRAERLWWGRRSVGLIAMGMLYVLQATAYFSSLRSVPAAVTSLLLYLYPAFVILLARLFLAEALTRGRVVALCLAVGGVTLVVNPLGAAGRHLNATGIVFGVASGVVYSLYIVGGPRLTSDVPAIVATAHIASVAGACFLTTAALTHSLAPLHRDGLALSVGMAALATVIPASLFLAGLRRIGPARAAILSTLEPITTVVLAGLLLGELLSPGQLVGGAAVLAAAVIVARASPPRVPTALVHE